MVHQSYGENAKNSNMGECTDFQCNNLDEQLITLVKERPAIYDLRLPQQDRTKLVKQALWHEISELMEERLKPDTAEIRWKYLRENYLKARKKQRMKEDMARRTGVPLKATFKNRKYSFRYYEIMQFLNDSLDYQKSIASHNAVKTKGLVNAKVQTSPRLSINPLTQVSSQLPSIKTIHSDVTADNFEEVSFDVDFPSSPISPPSSDFESSSNVKNNEISRFDQMFLECLRKPVEKPSPIDGFLLRLGEGLRRLPYRARSKLELEFLTRIREVEEQLELCNEI